MTAAKDRADSLDLMRGLLYGLALAFFIWGTVFFFALAVWAW